jgi:hypothetical protein
MSDYTSTFTEGTGDTIDAADFSTEFDAIEASIGTKADADGETLTNTTLTSPVINTGVSGTAVLDEDDMSSDSNTQIATQQSIKAYVDARSRTFEAAVTITSAGTTKDLSTTIPTWANRITITLDGVSTSAAASMILQVGDSGGFETSGYFTQSSKVTGTTLTSFTSPSGYALIATASGSDTVAGTIELIKHGTLNRWACTGTIYLESSSNDAAASIAGFKVVSSTLDRLRLALTPSGNFDAGTAVVSYSL